MSEPAPESTPETAPAHPPIVSREQWLTARKELLAEEKQLTRQRDAVNARRRRLPMVRIKKSYRFVGPTPGEARDDVSLLELFQGRRQLIIYHFMFDPEWTVGCPGCTQWVDAQGDIAMLHQRDTSFALVSRAPLQKLAQYQTQRKWTLPWYSSFDTDFNHDFHATLDRRVAPPMYNYADVSDRINDDKPREQHGLSVFFRIDNDVFHTYSAYARGCETLTDAYSLLDVTPYGRQEDFEDSPPGWPQKPTYG